MRAKIAATVVVLCLAAYFCFLAGPGLGADFTFDDLGNLYFGWIRPLPDWLQANVLFFIPPTRPLGKLFYALLFHFASFNPVPYRVVCTLFLAANVFLTYSFTLRLTRSAQVASLACLLHAYHGSSAALV